MKTDDRPRSSGDPARKSEPNNPDRRRCRSNYRYEAAGLFLQRLKHRARLRAVTLGDENGLVVVGAGRPRDLETLAIMGALSAADQGPWRDEIDAFAPQMPFFSMRIDVGKSELLLSGVGSADLSRTEVECALQRILA